MLAALVLTLTIAGAAGAQDTARSDVFNAARQVADLIDRFADTGRADGDRDAAFAALRMTYTRLPPGFYARSLTSSNIVYKTTRGLGACDVMLIDADESAGLRQAQRAHALTQAAMQCYIKELGYPGSLRLLRICNQFPHGVSVAFAYQADGRWISEGWYQVRTGTCASAYVQWVRGGKVYFRGASVVYPDPSGHPIRQIWGRGGPEFCANVTVLHFRYVDAKKPCGDEGQLSPFIELVGETLLIEGDAWPQLTLTFTQNGETRTTVSLK